MRLPELFQLPLYFLTLMQVSVEQDFSHARVNRAYEFADLSDYSFKDRLLIRVADLVFYLLINLAYVKTLGISGLAHSSAPAADVASRGTRP